jgi:hypothetical protein
MLPGSLHIAPCAAAAGTVSTINHIHMHPSYRCAHPLTVTSTLAYIQSMRLMRSPGHLLSRSHLQTSATGDRQVAGISNRSVWFSHIMLTR